MIKCFYSVVFLLCCSLVKANDFNAEFKKKLADFQFPASVSDSVKEKSTLLSFCQDKVSTKKVMTGDFSKIETIFEKKDLAFENKEKFFSAKIYFKLTKVKNIKVDKDEFDLFTYWLTVNWEQDGPSGGREFVVNRYLAKNGSVQKLMTATFDEAQSFSQLASVIEDELKSTYAATKVEENKDFIESLSNPPCEITFEKAPEKLKHWKQYNISFDGTDMLKRTEDGKDYWLAKKDSYTYIKSLDGLFYGYLLGNSLSFKYENRDYECTYDPGKRDSTSEIEVQRIVQNDLQGLAYEANLKDVGRIYKKLDGKDFDAFFGVVEGEYQTALSYWNATVGDRENEKIVKGLNSCSGIC